MEPFVRKSEPMPPGYFKCPKQKVIITHIEPDGTERVEVLGGDEKTEDNEK